MEFKILFGSETGNSEGLASDAQKELTKQGVEAEVIDMQDMTVEKLKGYKNILIFTSTWGEGDPPGNAENFYKELQNSSEIDLSHLNYAVFAIGQSFYEHFCKTGKDFDEFLEKMGAKRIAPIELCDDDFDSKFPEWIENIKKQALSKI